MLMHAHALPQDLYEPLREKVFIAERALLYALDFQFNVDHAYKVCLWVCMCTRVRARARACVRARVCA